MLITLKVKRVKSPSSLFYISVEVYWKLNLAYNLLKEIWTSSNILRRACAVINQAKLVTIKVMLHGTIRNDDFWCNTALQHCRHIVSNGYNIGPALQRCVAIVVANRHV